jgi:hypothetical protein
VASPQQTDGRRGAEMIAAGLLGEVVEAAGGESRWRAATRIRAHVRSGGLLPRTRVPGNRFADYTVTVETGRQYAVLHPFPREGLRGVFERGAVRIEARDGELRERRRRPREAFFGRAGLRRNLRWDALDSTYFAGYAMWNYLVTPLLLLRKDVSVTEGPEWSGEGERWRRLDARFPAEIETHSAAQSFFFDDAGRQVRHDYTAEVVSRRARAAHYCGEHRSYDGLLFATRRRVLPRRADLRSRPFPVLVAIDLEAVEVEFGA